MTKWTQNEVKIEASYGDDLKTRLLKARGIPEEEHTDFLFPDESAEHNPFDIRNMETAVDIILGAVRDGLDIVVSGDPDADGVTALAIIMNRLREFSDDYDFGLEYIYPQRDMGHGLLGQLTAKSSWEKDLDSEDIDKALTAKKSIDLIQDNRNKVEMADVLIVLDSSSNDILGVEKARKLCANKQLEIIILDHHQFDDPKGAYEMDEIALLVNPHHPKDTSLNKALSGAGMAYKASKGIDEMTDDEDNSNKYRDLMAVGMVGDMMSMKEMENRYLISQGLQNVANVGLTRILKGANVNMYTYNTKDIGFSIAPLINSSARMGEIELAIEILLVETDKEAKPLRLKMDKLNKKRQELQKQIAKKYEHEFDTSKKIILVVDEQSNKGFNGLVAQNLAQKYHKPAFVVRNINGKCMGSGRSFGDFNTQDFLRGLDYVEASGHGQAHGLVFPTDKLEDMVDYIEQNMPENLESERTIYYDIELSDLEEVMLDFQDLRSLNYITGTDFPEIVIRYNDLPVFERNVIGKTKETVKFNVMDTDLVLIKFKVNEDWNKDIDIFDTVDVVGSPTINEFYNFGTKKRVITPQIIIQDIEKCKE